MNFDWIIVDLIALAIIILVVAIAAWRGFFRTAVGLLGVIFAALAAAALATPAAKFLYAAVVRDLLRVTISRRIESTFAEGVPGANWFSALPGWAFRLMPPQAGAEPPDISGNIMAVVEQLIDSTLGPPILLLLRGASFFVLFAVFMLLSFFLSRLTWVINRIPMVGPLNVWLGGVLGVGQALIILWLLALLAQIYIAITGGGRYINADTLSDGYLFGVFYRMVSRR